MKDKGDFHVLAEDLLKALHLNDSQRKTRMDMLAEADVLENKNGETYISVQPYTEFILSTLDQLAASARELQSLDDLKEFEFLARHFLHEWAIIVGNLYRHIATEHRFESVDESVKTLEGLIGDMRTMFEYLVDANRLFIKFGRTPGKDSTGSQR